MLGSSFHLRRVDWRGFPVETCAPKSKHIGTTRCRKNTVESKSTTASNTIHLPVYITLPKVDRSFLLPHGVHAETCRLLLFVGHTNEIDEIWQLDRAWYSPQWGLYVRGYQPSTNDNFNKSCPIPVILVQILLSKYAIERWFYIPPHLFIVRSLPWETFKTLKITNCSSEGASFWE